MAEIAGVSEASGIREITGFAEVHVPAAAAAAPERGVVPMVIRSVPDERSSPPASRLRRSLVIVDVVAVLLAWAATLALADWGAGPRDVLVVLSVVAVTTLVLIYEERLYQSHVVTVRSEELARLAVVAVGSAATALLVSELIGVGLGGSAAIGGLVCYLGLALGRNRFQRWLTRRRCDGRYARSVVVAGDPETAAMLVELFDDSPELGLRAVGFVGSPIPGEESVGVPHLGSIDDLVEVVSDHGATGVVLCSPGMPTAWLNETIRDLHLRGVHVQISSGIHSVHRRRLRVQALGYEPLIYVEPMRLSKLQLALKRVLDVVGASLALVLVAPVLLVAVVAIKLDTGGPVLFRQRRVGRTGEAFTLLKLRTMDADAEDRLAEVAALNDRTGPLFKANHDPRVTRVGRVLRSSCIDEIPQLVNVLRGEMSLVGPRPALPAEVEEFEGRLRERVLVKPGVTGLWQVEGSDKPSFSVYRRLDLFYVDNWSVWLDLVVLSKTVGVVWRRVITAGAVRRHPASSGHPETGPAAAAVPTGALHSGSAPTPAVLGVSAEVVE
jgi:exopolysaccharide biosynthesis polyprenyl glycosylphosphotransferase